MSAPQRLDSKGIVIEDADGKPLVLSTVESIIEIWLDGGNDYVVENIGHWLGYGAESQAERIEARAAASQIVRQQRLERLAKRAEKARERRRKKAEEEGREFKPRKRR